PEGGKRADARPRAAVGAAHLDEFLDPHFRENSRQMIREIAHQGTLALMSRKLPGKEILEGFTGDIVVFAVAIDEIHGHGKRIIDISLETEAGIEGEGQHARAVRIDVEPNRAALREIARRLAVQKR